MRINVAPPDRASLAMANMLAGSPDAAVRSLLAPDTLTPLEHRDIVDRYFGEGESPSKSLVRFLTNPITIVAAALVWKYPIPSMMRLAASESALRVYDRYIPTTLRYLAGFNEIFHKTGVDDAFAWVSRRLKEYHTTYMTDVGKGLTAFEQTYKRSLSAAEQVHGAYEWDILGADGPNIIKGIQQKLGEVESKLASGLWTSNKYASKGVIPKLTDADFMLKSPLAGPAANVVNLAKASVGRQWQEIVELEKDPKALRAMLRDLYSQSIAMDTGVTRGRASKRAAQMVAAAAKEAGTGPLVAEVPGMFPHVMIRTADESAAAMQQRLMESLPLMKRDPSGKAIRASMQRLTSSTLAPRRYQMLPNPDHLQILADNGLIDPKIPQAIRTAVEIARENRSPIPVYDMRTFPVVEHYTHSLARAKTWRATPFTDKSIPMISEEGYRAGPLPPGETTIPPEELKALVDKAGVRRMTVSQWLDGAMRDMLANGGDRGKRMVDLLVNTYIPTQLGRQPMEQYMKSLEWGGLREATARLLSNPTVKNTLGPQLHKRLNDMVNYGSPWLTWQGLGGKISGYFYMTTLGFNPATAAQNLLQSFLTTGTVVKPKYMMEGFDATFKGMQKASKLMKMGLTEQEAIERVFPEFGRQALEVQPLFREAITGAVGSADPLSVGSGAGGKASWLARKFGEKSLALFGLTERYNHLWAFNAAHKQALAEGLSGELAGQTAAKVVRLTQNWAGPLALPSGMMNWWAPTRQFMTFPSKLAAFYGLSGANYGGIFNRGTLGRALIASTGLYELGRGVLDADLSRSLMFGAVPGPADRGPFAPLPVVPPIFALMGAAGLDLAHGEFSELRRVLPLAIPGGVSAARAVPLLANRLSPGAGEQAGQAITRPYADYQNPTPDGRIPVYSSAGGQVGYFTPQQIVMRAMGMGGGGGEEGQLSKYIVRQRDQIRAARRAYVNAIMSNNMPQAIQINTDYERRLGIGPIRIKPSDLQAYGMRQDVSRLERLMQTLPEEARPMYAHIIGTAMGQGAQSLMGIDPAMLSTGTIQSRRSGAGGYAPMLP